MKIQDSGKQGYSACRKIVNPYFKKTMESGAGTADAEIGKLQSCRYFQSGIYTNINLL